jgi:hypothetical protein
MRLIQIILHNLVTTLFNVIAVFIVLGELIYLTFGTIIKTIKEEVK